VGSVSVPGLDVTVTLMAMISVWWCGGALKGRLHSFDCSSTCPTELL
jgi:hypothetical protein